MKRKRPELLAPAGSPEAFAAALAAGADAVYLGLDRFNARLRARNFTLNQLAGLLPRARERNVRVYLTFNTLLRQAELTDALDLAWRLREMGVDALILQDLGLARLIRRHCPGLAIHASTQLVCHNRAGADILARLGFSRVILARELSLAQIAQISRTAPLETEVFVHGAVCYSLSGLCLASSLLGGASGNRGRCTQVCRREFFTDTGSVRPFSPGDFCAADHLETLLRCGVSCLKIEGRMRSAEYVARVTAAWRSLLDGGDPEEARRQLRQDFGRPQHHLFLTGQADPELIDARLKPGTGLYLGRVTAVDGRQLTLHWAEGLDPEVRPVRGDRLRLQRGDEEGESLRVEAWQREGPDRERLLVDPARALVGDEVYLAGRGDFRIRKLPPARGGALPGPFPGRRRLLRDLTLPLRPQKIIRTEWRTDDPAWLETATDEEGWILDLDRASLRLMPAWLAARPERARHLAVVPPPLILPGDFPDWQRGLARLAEAGVAELICANLGHLAFAEPFAHASAEASLWTLNGATLQALARLGLRSAWLSPEDELPNIRRLASTGARLTIFGRPRLFVSCIPPQTGGAERLIDREGRGFLPRQRDSLYTLFRETPLCLFARRQKLLQAGLRRFVIDLRTYPVDPALRASLAADWQAGKRRAQTDEGNFKHGLK